jgi:hypothetical protein
MVIRIWTTATFVEIDQSDVYRTPVFIFFQNIRKIDGGSGPARFRLMMSDGQHSMSCE